MDPEEDRGDHKDAIACDGDYLRLHGLLAESRANGPGRRAVVWVQGCALGCRDCFNPETHAADGGRLRPVAALVEEIARLAPRIEGLTVSGGEPFQQPGALRRLLEGVRARSRLSVLVFSGCRLEEIQDLAEGPAILRQIDVLVAGRYVATRPFGAGLLGSASQTVHFLSDRYDLRDIQACPAAEIQLDVLGRVAVTGVAPPLLSGLAGLAGQTWLAEPTA